MFGNGDRCPRCDEFQMPVIPRGSHLTGRCCQSCGHVEEIEQSFPVVFPEVVYMDMRKNIYYDKEIAEAAGIYAEYSRAKN